MARLSTTVSLRHCACFTYPHTPLQHDAHCLLSTQTCFQLQHTIKCAHKVFATQKLAVMISLSEKQLSHCVQWCCVLSRRIVCTFMDTVKTPHSFQLCGISTFSVLLSRQIATVLGYTACSWKPPKSISKHEKEINHYILHVINSL